jgi:hypothetical protein
MPGSRLMYDTPKKDIKAIISFFFMTRLVPFCLYQQLKKQGNEKAREDLTLISF